LKLSRKELENTICLACAKKFGEHTKERGTKFSLSSLMECMFRIQGTYMEIADMKQRDMENHPGVMDMRSDISKGETDVKH